MITHVSEKETRLAHLLSQCSDVLKQATKERDALHLAAQAAIDAMLGVIHGDPVFGKQIKASITQLQAALRKS
jgi:hypothetical protein